MCLLALVSMISPRLGIFLLWAFSGYVDRAFETQFWPILGFFFAPWATLFYILVAANGDVTIFEWIIVLFGLLADFGSVGSSYTSGRGRYPRGGAVYA